MCFVCLRLRYFLTRNPESRSGVVSCTEVDGSCTILTAQECFGGSALFDICQEEQNLYQSEDWCVMYVLSRAEMLEVRRHVNVVESSVVIGI